jgi:hypothetical protein
VYPWRLLLAERDEEVERDEVGVLLGEPWLCLARFALGVLLDEVDLRFLLLSG